MKRTILAVFACILLVGCDDQLSRSREEWEQTQAQAASTVAKLEKKRDEVRQQLRVLTLEKKGLEDFNPTPVITNITQTNIIIVTNLVTTIDVSPDGRVGAQKYLRDTFNTKDIFSLPYSPHEYFLRSSNRLFYVTYSPSFPITNAFIVIELWESK